jgi:hypothetical protein
VYACPFEADILTKPLNALLLRKYSKLFSARSVREFRKQEVMHCGRAKMRDPRQMRLRTSRVLSEFVGI